MNYTENNRKAAAAAGPTFAAPISNAINSPLNFSQISTLLKCPVVGICMTGAEQRTLVRKSGMLAQGAAAFDIHEILVGLTDEDNALARRADVLLRRKYEARAMPLRQLPLPKFMECWERAFNEGDFAAELWAAASRKDMPLALQRHIFGCVHMGMHNALEINLEQQRKLRLFRQERAIASEKFKEVKLSLTRLRKEQRHLQKERDALAGKEALARAENERLKARLSSRGQAGLEELEKECVELRRQVESLKDLVKSSNERAAAEEKRHAATMEEAGIQRYMVLQLQKEIGLLLKSSASCEGCDKQCEQCAACPRRVLLVGGMTRMEPLYRQLVEGRGDEFEYHDGCLCGVNNLEKSLQRADLILCPVNCNSHRACLTVKNLCKKYKKEVQMMSNFSLSAVSRAIEQ